MKISNELLSAVLGVECEFCFINDKYDAIEFTSSNISNILRKNKYTTVVGITWNWSISLDTFIRLAKVWAFENGYAVEEFVGIVRVYGDKLKCKIVKTIMNCDNNLKAFDPRIVLQALEWVYNEIGGKNA